MSSKQGVEWSRLDNAAKIFPSTAFKTNTNVFRFACELHEEVREDVLADAVKLASEEFPSFLCVMRKGLFWHYLERCKLQPVVSMENRPPCSSIYKSDKRSLLFNVTYYKSRINLEMYHVLGDGTGAMQFLKAIVYHYLLLRHPLIFEKEKPLLDFDASLSQKNADSFQKYYKRNLQKAEKGVKKAYPLKGAKRDDGRLQVIEAVVSATQVLKAAHSYNTSLTVYLTALFISAIHEEMLLRHEKYPIVLNVPVNLRSYFDSETVKNFFGMIDVSYSYKTNSGTLEDMIDVVSRRFKSELTKEKLGLRMNALAALEHNLFIKIAPLSLKNWSLKIARKVNDMGVTAVISNMGKVDMPAAMCPFIKLFDVISATPKLQLCLCSFGDNLTLSFSSAFISTDIQKNFVRQLTQSGIEAEIRCNHFNTKQVNK